ncbi:MAG: carboxylating nicotinate-nucleotide diphosphorylase [Myxococcales bacterium FL481]|nr:MAG: carboxylating nicotinate-nucleotide diphosphorylase [Myxococcales bacterium FL481]
MKPACAVGQPPDLREAIAAALREDLSGGDVTTRCTVPHGTEAGAKLVAREDLVVCGMSVVRQVFTQVDATVDCFDFADDGESVAAGAVLGRLQGPAASLLAGERTALNLLQRSCGVATQTQAYVAAARGRLRVADTRKTMPGLRALDRYAVRCGGGHNHRNDLGGGVLIKENHVRAAGGISPAVRRARDSAPHLLKVACEVETLDQLDEAIAAGAEIVLLDNMDDDTVRRAVARGQDRVILEVSGGITLERIDVLAELGVDVVSVGALTHSARAADISLLFEAAMS